MKLAARITRNASALALALSLVGPATELTAQRRPEAPAAKAPGPAPAIFIGAAVGSVAGLYAWGSSGQIYNTDQGEALATGMLATTIGSALGGWIASGATDAPSLGHLFVGSLIGIAGGILVGHVAAGAFDDNRGSALPTAVLGFVVGQAATTAWVGSILAK